ncbi:hypothetical protein DFJ74DRAFT_767989 [Hyaloraphidium curvatum]|nr:hypothetical protein DFJ74DRAFT_767989 [Hyaloraphidium curvatum]
MRPLLRALAVAAAAGLAALPAAADTWCNGRPANESFCVTGTDAGEWVDIVMVGPSTLGWMAFGIGESHKDADILVAWLADGVTIVSPRYSRDYVEPEYDATILSNQQIIVFPDSRVVNDTFRVHVQRRKQAVTNKDKTLYPGPQTYMYAMQTEGMYSPKSTDYQAHIMRHDMFGVIPLFSLYNNAAPRRPSVFTAEWFQDKTMLTAHGWMMFISWGIVAPLWAFSQRYIPGTSKMWDTVHYASHVVLVGCMTIAAFGIAVYAVSPAAHFNDAHSVIGLIVFLLMFVEIGLNAYVVFRAPPASTPGVAVASKTAELQPELAEGSAGRPGRIARLAHTILLALLLTLAYVAVGTGIKQFAVRYGDTSLMTAAIVIFSIYITLLTLGLLFVGERYLKRRAKAPEINMGTITSLTDSLGRKVEETIAKLDPKKPAPAAAPAGLSGYETDDQALVNNKSPYHVLED